MAGCAIAKLTDKDRLEIVELFYDKGMSQIAIAKQYGVHNSTISKIVNEPETLAKMLKHTSAERVRTQMRINRHLLEAADVQIELMRGEYEDQYKYLKQNAARDILDRGGVRADKEEQNEMQISVTIGGSGMQLGVPDHSMDNEEEADTECTQE